MELWVRSQDKCNLVKVNQISLNYADNKQIIANCTPEPYANAGNYYEFLGIYKSKERALEVLDEIQNAITAQFYISTDYKAALRNIDNTEEMIDKLNQMIVYEMPKE